MNQLPRHLTAVVLAALLMAGCDLFGESKLGTCDVIKETPLIEITSATAVSSNESISTISLTDFVVEEDSVGMQFPGLREGENIEVEGDSLVCSFARQQATYAFTASAPNYESKRVDLGDVEYANREEQGPCPRIIFSGSEEVSISLTQTQEAP